ncbi:branched-chain amino acid ABC transporter permease [Acuticoccus mangrovi]|uniref:Branched-chain amino acid ABC transporter permease n=1 Tax=Acuticoccus mangrovi TaxID=2796142 RepID=A0A934IJY8_9HYPH|nr:branched-chain amino acid ABC transporter permease [Acuticoccus mangrovi]MBJ3778069.1 branched-chain amino acid ABC transporter permease [Acuticoccus mangrovi]
MRRATVSPAAFLVRHSTVFILVVLMAAMAVVTVAVGDKTLVRTVAEIYIRTVIVVALYIFIGNSGVISFGSIAFVMIGAYASAWQTCCKALKPMSMVGLPDFLRLHTYPVFFASITSAILAALVAFVVGIPILRLSGIPSSIATFALLAIVFVIYSNWNSVTLGLLSVVGLPLYVDIWVALGWAVVVIVVAYIYQSSRYGLLLRATREDEVAAEAGGINIARQRLIAWVISGFFLGVAGVLYGHFVGVISVKMFYLDLTFISLAMLVVGGMRSLTGAVVGVVVLSTITELLRRAESGFHVASLHIQAPVGSQEVSLGIIMLLLLIFRPNGLTNGREIAWPRALTRSARSGGGNADPSPDTAEQHAG